MDKRIKTTYRWEPEGNADKGEPLDTFALLRIREPQKETRGGRWIADESHELYPSERTELATMSRRAMTEAITDGIEWLSYLPKDDE